MNLMDGMNLIFTLFIKSIKSIKSISAAMEQPCIPTGYTGSKPPFIAFALPPAVKFRSLVQP